jgi:hypothetical protein
MDKHSTQGDSAMKSAAQEVLTLSSDAIREVRKSRNESQSRFWSRFGVTQTRGSRFELGNAIPSPVAILLRLYLEGTITDGDLWRAKRHRRQQRRANSDGVTAMTS